MELLCGRLGLVDFRARADGRLTYCIDFGSSAQSLSVVKEVKVETDEAVHVRTFAWSVSLLSILLPDRISFQPKCNHPLCVCQATLATKFFALSAKFGLVNLT